MSPRPEIPALAAAAVTGAVLAACWAAIRRERRRGPAPSGFGPAGEPLFPGRRTPAAQEAPDTPDRPDDGEPRKDARTAGQTLEEMGQELRRYWDRLRPFYPDQHP